MRVHSGTQVAVFVELANGDTMRLDAVRLQIDGQLVAHYIYSAKELQALRKGGVQRIYVGNVTTWNHNWMCLSTPSLRAAPISAARDNLLSAKKRSQNWSD